MWLVSSQQEVHTVNCPRSDMSSPSTAYKTQQLLHIEGLEDV